MHISSSPIMKCAMTSPNVLQDFLHRPMLVSLKNFYSLSTATCLRYC
jgi:hypothetical protein